MNSNSLTISILSAVAFMSVTSQALVAQSAARTQSAAGVQTETETVQPDPYDPAMLQPYETEGLSTPEQVEQLEIDENEIFDLPPG